MSRRRRTVIGRARRRCVSLALRLSVIQWALIAAAALTAAIAAGVAVIVLDHGSSTPPASSFTGPPVHGVPSSTGTAEPSTGAATVRLVVPAGGIDIQVIPGDGVHVPLHLAMHYPGTSWPGEGRDSLFYGHAQPGMFLGLFHVHLGDSIQAVRADGSQVLYKVRAIRQVAYNDVSVLGDTQFEQITLLTCTSYNPYGSRLVVIGTPV